MMTMYMGKAYRVQVVSRTTDRTYQVFVFGTDLESAVCNCPAGKNAKACWHLEEARREVVAILDMIREGTAKPFATLTVPEGATAHIAGPVRADLFHAGIHGPEEA